MAVRLLLSIGLFLAPLTAVAQAAGTVVEGSLALGPKVVPLPAGPWRLVHLGVTSGRTIDGNVNTRTHEAVLVQEAGGRAVAVIVARAAQEVGVHWDPHGICVNPNAFSRHIAVAVRGSIDCRGQVAIGSGRGANTPAYLNAFYDEGQRRPGWMPARWVSAQFVLSEQMHYLSIEYRFAPAVFVPLIANAANWNDGARNAVQNAFVDRIDAWAAGAHAELRRGLYGRQPAAPLPAPF